ncbi:MAG: hypothetical protein ACRDV7_05540, partial [Acidimicrobiia bacterium]
MGERRHLRGRPPLGGGRITTERVCRVVPDVTAVERVFDYLVPDALGARVRVGTIVRVPLHGRRVRGWVVADGVEPESGARLLPIAAVVSEGPPPDVVALTKWVAWRWSGPRVAVLRTTSPPNIVPPLHHALELASDSSPSASTSTPVRSVARVVRVPPL